MDVTQFRWMKSHCSCHSGLPRKTSVRTKSFPWASASLLPRGTENGCVGFHWTLWDSLQRGKCLSWCVLEVALKLHCLAHTSQSWRSLCAWPDGCQRDQPVALLFYRPASNCPKEGIPQLSIRTAEACPPASPPTSLLSGKQAVAYTTRGCLLHLSEVPAAEVSACSKLALSPRRVLLHELMLQGK